MKPKLICLYLIVLITHQSFSQEKDASVVTTVIKVTILNPGFSYEQAVGKTQTIYGQAFLNVSGYYSYSSSLGTSSAIYLDPAFTIQYRHYYNAAKREKREKRVAFNSLNYVAPVWEISFAKLSSYYNYYYDQKRLMINRVGVVWGLQRNYKSRFSLDINVGPGYVFAKPIESSGMVIKPRVSEFTILGQLNLGIWLNKRN